MRRAAILLLLLAACDPRRNPRDIERALSTKTIDVEALEDLLGVEEGALRLIAPPLLSTSLSPALDDWCLENVGRRPLWLRRSDLLVEVTVIPFLHEGSRWGGRFGHSLGGPPPPRPTFSPEEWIVVERGGRVPLTPTSRQSGPGTYTYAVAIPTSGRDLCWRAREFTAGKRLPRPKEHCPWLLQSRVEQLVLPSLDWPGEPWHSGKGIDLKLLGGTRFEMSRDVFDPFESSGPIPLEAFVLDEKFEVIHRDSLRVEDHESWPGFETWVAGPDRLLSRTRYALSDPPRPGNYNLLVRAPDPEPYLNGGGFQTSTRSATASRWIPFRVE